MGRPIKKIFIGNRAAGGIGGQGLEDVTLGGTNNSTGYTTGEALTISAPDLNDGVQAVGEVTATAGEIDGIVITEEGSGYTSAPTVSAATGTQGTLTLTGVLTARPGTIACTAYIEGGSNNSADIEAQKGGTTYRVTTSDGTGECTLVAATPSAAGEMAIPATDSGAATYWVTKLTNRTVRITENSGGGEFATNDIVGWADVAVLNTSVKITH